MYWNQKKKKRKKKVLRKRRMKLDICVKQNQYLNSIENVDFKKERRRYLFEKDTGDPEIQILGYAFTLHHYQ